MIFYFIILIIIVIKVSLNYVNVIEKMMDFILIMLF